MSKLGKVMKEKGISQAQLARIMGFNRVTVGDQVKKGFKKIETAKKYAAALGVDWQDLID